MKICFTGDLFLGGDLLNQTTELKINSRLFNDADMRVVNLEQPISDSEYIENKCTLYTGSNAVGRLSEKGVTAANLAHNHIQDKGQAGISETVEHLRKASIGTFGAGSDIEKASKPFWLNNEIGVLGYCDYNKPYLKEVVVATNNEAGVNPLRLKKILSDLDDLPENTKVIIYLHWGMEHIWLPPHDDLMIMKTLLENEKVISVIGSHPHRIQGKVEHFGKVGFMCLGNFLFPNFYIKPATKICYPKKEVAKKVKFYTKLYHHVYELTYKKWLWINRVSLVVQLDSGTNEISTEFVKQLDESPEIVPLNKLESLLITFLFNFISFLYFIPKPLYHFIWSIQVIGMKVLWRFRVGFFHLKQLGCKKFLGKVKEYARKKRD